jgi:hypothetical protein
MIVFDTSRRRRGSPIYLGKAVRPGATTRGAVAVLRRLDLFRTTAEPQSCLTGAPITMG